MPLKPRPPHANAAAAGARQPDRGVARNPGAPNLLPWTREPSMLGRDHTLLPTFLFVQRKTTNGMVKQALSIAAWQPQQG